MCDVCSFTKPGWKGWLDIPPAKLSASEEPWTEISHVLTEDLSRIPSFPRPRIEVIATIPEHMANVTEIQMVCHHGTHVDAPRHFLSDGPPMEQVPLDRLYGTGIVIDIERDRLTPIQPRDLEAAGSGIREGDIVYLRTGWSDHVNMPDYLSHPWLTAEAGEWLLARRIKLLGVDFATPDVAFYEREPGFTFPVHHCLLAHGVLIAEHLNLPKVLAGRRIDTMFMALSIAGADGAPARVVARPSSH